MIHVAARPACRSFKGSVRPVVMAGQRAASKHKPSVAAKPIVSLAQGMISGTICPPRIFDVTRDARTAIAGHDAEAEAQQASHDADEDRFRKDHAEEPETRDADRAALPCPIGGHGSTRARC